MELASALFAPLVPAPSRRYRLPVELVYHRLPSKAMTYPRGLQERYAVAPGGPGAVAVHLPGVRRAGVHTHTSVTQLRCGARPAVSRSSRLIVGVSHEVARAAGTKRLGKLREVTDRVLRLGSDTEIVGAEKAARIV